jgi:hypothetical protein
MCTAGRQQLDSGDIIESEPKSEAGMRTMALVVGRPAHRTEQLPQAYLAARSPATRMRALRFHGSRHTAGPWPPAPVQQRRSSWPGSTAVVAH